VKARGHYTRPGMSLVWTGVEKAFPRNTTICPSRPRSQPPPPYKTPPCEAPMPFSIRTYLHFPVSPCNALSHTTLDHSKV
jgi:hypothetical protein